MKKGITILVILLVSMSIFWLGFDYKESTEPNTYYQVFLDGELIGTVSSKAKLERYIDNQNDYVKNKYKVDTVYSPNGLEIEKIVTFENNTDKISDVYEKIKAKKPFTIKGYQLTIKSEDEEIEDKIVYATEKNIFESALEKTIITFVGNDNYNNYINNTQAKITTTGTTIENVYIENEKTIKEVYISTDEQIYTDADSLSQFFIFGPNMVQSNYIVKVGDTISSIAFNHEISVEELLLSNSDITSSKNLLYNGQTLKIAETNPQVSVVVEEYVVEDVTNPYSTIEQYDEDLAIGNDKVTQYGSNGLDRVSKDVKIINGNITYVNTQSKIEIEPTIDKIIVIGKKYIPTVGSLTSWGWPTNGGYTISSDYGYRINPINGVRELHNGIDIAGTGYGSNIYAVNNGVVITASYHYINGNYVVINHNNGYYTYYGHMSQILVQVGQTVARGEVIGLIGQTGWATGPHVHFGIYTGDPDKGAGTINPWSVY
ncbi:MAG: M23 family metallopeptidase [Bacilli bacterium]|nr:M23 family metallopeptidase [Bacilli bacterium]